LHGKRDGHCIDEVVTTKIDQAVKVVRFAAPPTSPAAIIACKHRDLRLASFLARV
jgi:hypothetical protein